MIQLSPWDSQFFFGGGQIQLQKLWHCFLNPREFHISYKQLSLNVSFFIVMFSKIRFPSFPPTSVFLQATGEKMLASNSRAALTAGSAASSQLSELGLNWEAILDVWKWGLLQNPRGLPSKGKSHQEKIRQHRQQRQPARQVSPRSPMSGAAFIFPSQEMWPHSSKIIIM